MALRSVVAWLAVVIEVQPAEKAEDEVALQNNKSYDAGSTTYIV